MPCRWVEGDLGRLAQYGLQLNLALPPARLADPGLNRLLCAAADQGVPVGAWLLLEDVQGYWPNAENAKPFQELVSRFLDRLEREQLKVAEIIVDMETPLALSRLLKGRLIQGLQLEWQRWQSPLNRERFENSVGVFTQLVEDLHSAGLTVQVVTYPFIVHDAAANNLAFQAFLQVPVTLCPGTGFR